MKKQDENHIPEVSIRQQINQLRQRREQEFLAKVNALAVEYGLTLTAIPVISSDGKITAQVIVNEQ